MKERIVEIKITKKQFCYREQKFKEEKEKICPFGFKKFQDECNNCRWYGENVLSSEIVKTMRGK